MQVVFLGSKNTGKTSLMDRLTYNKYKDTYLPTQGVDTEKIKYGFLNRKEIILSTFSGDFRFIKIARAYYSKSNLFILTFDLNNKRSLLDIKFWFDEIYKLKIEIVLVGVKSDIETIPFTEIIPYINKYKAIYFPVSCKTGQGVSELRRYIISLKNKIIT